MVLIEIYTKHYNFQDCTPKEKKSILLYDNLKK